MFTISWNGPNFYLWQPVAEKKRYAIEVRNATLHVDTCVLSASSLSTFQNKFITLKKPVIYNYSGELVFLPGGDQL